MRTSLDHLPPAKQRELERVLEVLFAGFEEATALATQAWKKKGRILKIVLYGSYARGGWVDEPHTAKGYKSDFDLLVVVNDKRLTDRDDLLRLSSFETSSPAYTVMSSSSSPTE